MTLTLQAVPPLAPHVHMNGTSKQELVDQQIAIMDAADALLAAVGPAIEERLGDRIYSRDGATLETVIGEQLRGRNATLSVAESCTAGLLGGRITSVAGSSEYFVGGFLVYSDRLKTDLLGVDPELLARHSAVSEECAKAMAAGARTRTGSRQSRNIRANIFFIL